MCTHIQPSNLLKVELKDVDVIGSDVAGKNNEIGISLSTLPCIPRHYTQYYLYKNIYQRLRFRLNCTMFWDRILLFLNQQPELPPYMLKNLVTLVGFEAAFSYSIMFDRVLLSSDILLDILHHLKVKAFF